MEIWGENSFKIRAYQKASRILDNFTDDDIKSLIIDKELLSEKGIGKNLFNHIEEIYHKGSFKELDDLISKIPQGLIDMLQVRGLGPKKIQAIYQNLGISEIDELKEACKNGRLKTIPGFKQRTVDNILKGIDLMDRTKGLIRYDIAYKEACTIRNYIHSHIQNPVYIAGSLRRFKELVHDIDIVTYFNDIEFIEKILSEAPFLLEIPQKGKTKITLITNKNIQCDIRIVKKDELYAALHYLTGSKEHNTKMRAIAKSLDLKLNEYGIFKKDNSRLPVHSEADIFYNLGMKQYIPPILREDMGEIEKAMENAIPELIKQDQILGVFHCHTNMSDGNLSLEQIVKIAQDRKLQYIGIADHSQSAYYAGGLKTEDLYKQWQLIDNINNNSNIRLLKGIESDILPDGSLDYPEEILQKFDFIIGSVHSNYRMEKDKMTDRIIKALSNPYLDILGHPSGRLLKRRDPYDIDMMKIIKTAIKYNKYIEINAHPQRMDIDWLYLKKGIELGLKSLISLDIHSIYDFDHIPIGINIAQKAWAKADDILNTKNYTEVRKAFKK